jgi:two-component system CheB/CheR fusion protein
VREFFARLGEHFLVKPRLRNLVTFTQANLVQPAYIGRFDCIFCLDVLSHFSSAQRTALLERLQLYLEPGGYLILGEEEKISSSAGKFLPQDEPFLYRKPMIAAAKSGQ